MWRTFLGAPLYLIAECLCAVALVIGGLGDLLALGASAIMGHSIDD